MFSLSGSFTRPEREMWNSMLESHLQKMGEYRSFLRVCREEGYGFPGVARIIHEYLTYDVPECLETVRGRADENVVKLVEMYWEDTRNEIYPLCIQ